MSRKTIGRLVLVAGLATALGTSTDGSTAGDEVRLELAGDGEVLVDATVFTGSSGSRLEVEVHTESGDDLMEAEIVGLRSRTIPGADAGPDVPHLLGQMPGSARKTVELPQGEQSFQLVLRPPPEDTYGSVLRVTVTVRGFERGGCYFQCDKGPPRVEASIDDVAGARRL